MDTNFSSTQNTGNLIDFIEKIPSRGVPPKVGQTYLEGLGYKSKNDRTIIAVLKSLNVLESNGGPNDNYSLLRNRTNRQKSLAKLIISSYSELFEIYPDAQNQDDVKLQDYFASKTSVGEASLRNIIKTFKALCKAADFSGGPTPQRPTNPPPAHTPQQQVNLETKLPPQKVGSSEIHFNIQVHIPGEQKPEVYESIFKNLGKYVLGIKDSNE